MNTTDAATLARSLMIEHGVGDWAFEFDRAKKRAGCCKHRKHMLTLSSYYIQNNSDEDIKDTILHEIAHAIAGPKQGHNEVWKTICRKIGARPIRCYGSHVDMPKGRWQAKCPTCKQEFHCHRKPKNHKNRYCRACGPVNGSMSFALA
ncbi:SprT-like domain-containing protein [Nitrospira sp. BLG_2]|uniref:SprT-like domain-containing protein n=1 Tax=Nitrospira sp. BLG_2 TaxID=3397507 RepID=UPI003B9CC8DE